MLNERYKRNVSKAKKIHVLNRQNYICKSCKKLLELTYQIDHIRPLWHGGSNHICNLQALCPNCHARKTAIETQQMPIKYKKFYFCPLCKGRFSLYFGHSCDLFQEVKPNKHYLRIWRYIQALGTNKHIFKKIGLQVIIFIALSNR